MKKILIATTALALMCGSAFAQGTGPSTQGDTMTKPGMNNDSMKKGSMDKGSMTKGTTGMNNGMKDPNANVPGAQYIGFDTWQKQSGKWCCL